MTHPDLSGSDENSSWDTPMMPVQGGKADDMDSGALGAPGADFDAFNQAVAAPCEGRGQPDKKPVRKGKAVPLAEFLGDQAGEAEACPTGANYALWRGLKEAAPRVPDFVSRPPSSPWTQRRLHIPPDSYRRQPWPAEDRPKLDLAATGRLIRFTVGRPKPPPVVTFKGRGTHFGARGLDDAAVDYGPSAHARPLRSDAVLRRPSL
eukprot:EG_transcript_20345